jgi:hypothetical protein
MIFWSELSAAGRSTLTSTAPQRLIVPANTESPTAFSTGVASPVRLDSSAAVVPFSTSASTGNCEPGFTSKRIPGLSNSTLTSVSLPCASSTVAVFGASRKRSGFPFASGPTRNAPARRTSENRNNNVAPSPHAPMLALPPPRRASGSGHQSPAGAGAPRLPPPETTRPRDNSRETPGSATPPARDTPPANPVRHATQSRARAATSIRRHGRGRARHRRVREIPRRAGRPWGTADRASARISARWDTSPARWSSRHDRGGP